MNLKQREKSDFYPKLRKKTRSFFRILFNKKTKIILAVSIMIGVFVIGGLSGLLISGFFGTFDNPSQRAIDLMHAIGMTNLRGIKSIIETTTKSILIENIKIPFNYLSGQFSKPEKIFINIDFEDYQKIVYKREQALDRGILVVLEEDYVPATIRYQDKEVTVWLRLKGDMPTHFEGDKWSFRIKVRGEDTLFGMKTFSIQTPESRGYINELIYHYALKKEGILSLRYKFIDVTINGKHKGVYNLEEHFDKYLLEYNNRREGPIIRFNEDVYWDELLQEKIYFPEKQYINSNFYPASTIDSFKTNQTLEDPIKLAQFNQAKNLLESFRRGELKAHEAFDVDLTAKYFAIGAILGAPHASYWTNIRFYYNPITSLLEPIGYDASIINYINDEGVLGEWFPQSLEISNFPYENSSYSPHLENVYAGFFSDPIFYEKYVEELERVSKKSYLDNLFEELDGEIKKDTRIIHKEKPYYHFFKEIFYDNQKYIQRILDPATSINAYFIEKNPEKNSIRLSIGNVYSLPIEVLEVTYGGYNFEFEQKNIVLQPKKPDELVDYNIFEVKIPDNFEWKDEFALSLEVNYRIFGAEKIRNESVLPWSQLDEDSSENDFVRQKPSLELNEFLEINNVTNEIKFKRGSWVLNKSLIIPEGYTFSAEGGTNIDLIDGAMILSYSKLQFLGSEKNPIKIISSDKTGQGLAVLNAKKDSIFNYVYFRDLTNPSKNDWILTGAITFYESPFKFNNVIIKGMNSEDSLNIIRSKFEIKNSVFEDCFFDCLDIDFGEGFIESSSFINCGNDCVDFSGSSVEINHLDIMNPGDKGVSVGEGSNVNAEDLKINGGYICVASKDLSKLDIEKLEMSNCSYGFAVYQKKSEFGSASINSIETEISSVEKEYIIERGSSLSVNGKIILDGEEEVYKKLYPS